jgi:hypothetical protein
MEGVSTVVAYDLTAGEDRLVSAGPRVLTSFLVCERTNTEPAAVLLTGAGGQGPYFRVRLPPGGQVALVDAVALPWGLMVVCEMGEVTISLAYR